MDVLIGLFNFNEDTFNLYVAQHIAARQLEQTIVLYLASGYVYLVAIGGQAVVYHYTIVSEACLGAYLHEQSLVCRVLVVHELGSIG